MTSDSRIYFMAMTAICCGFFAIGIYIEGLIGKASMLACGFYLGHLITEALNYDETNTARGD